MRNYLCKFCTVPCKKDSVDDNRYWTCKHCSTKYGIDLYSEDKFHYMTLEENASYIWDRSKPDDRYLIRVDFIKNTTTVFRLCKISSLRTKVLELPYSFLIEQRVTKSRPYDIKLWLEYNLNQSTLPITPPVVTPFKCLSCGDECKNMNPRFGLYWDCDHCSAWYYLEDNPPHELKRMRLSIPKEEYSRWVLEINYKKQTTNLSFSEDKSEVDVLHLDFVVKNVFAYNLREWIEKKLVWL